MVQGHWKSLAFLEYWWNCEEIIPTIISLSLDTHSSILISMTLFKHCLLVHCRGQMLTRGTMPMASLKAVLQNCHACLDASKVGEHIENALKEGLGTHMQELLGWGVGQV